MPTTILLHLLMCIVPQNDGTVVDYVDEIEVNALCDCWNARVTFKQLLFRRWNDATSYHEIVAWRMVKDKTYDVGWDQQKGLWAVRWKDGFGGENFRVVYAKSIRHSFSIIDIEVAERERLPMAKRQELSKRKPIINMETETKENP